MDGRDLSSRLRRPGLAAVESVAVFLACLVASVAAAGRLLRDDVFSEDALVHQFWLWRYRDPALFTDPLTADLRASARYPDGYELLFRGVVDLVDPIAFGEWLGVLLMAISGWLVFRIVRDHTDWKPAAWIAAALFLALMDIHRFYGGFPRAFVHPVVLLTVLLAMRGRQLPAALVAGSGALLYPPAALLAGGVLAWSALGWRDRRPRVDLRRAAYAGLAIGVSAVLVLLAGEGPRVFTADEAREYPEFGEEGPLHFFVDSLTEYLRQNRSGFDLRGAGSTLLIATLALLAFRPGTLKLLRREVIALPVVALGAFTAAQLVLFKLYLPHRYTYPLVAFMAIAVGVGLRPAWEAITAGGRSRAGIAAMVAAPVVAFFVGGYLLPIGPTIPWDPTTSWRTIAVVAGVAALAAALALRRISPATGAIVTAVLLCGAMLLAPDRSLRGSPCPDGAPIQRLGTLPKDAIIAGDPIDLKCFPGTVRRSVVISTQLAPSYEVDYFLRGRERMFAMLRAYFGPSLDGLREVRERYGATHLWLRRNLLEQEAAGETRWFERQNPYGRYVRDLVRQGEPAALSLPETCMKWRDGGLELYDLACVTGDAPPPR